MPALLDCKLFLLIMSKESNVSDECLNELGIAIKHKKLIVPVYIDKLDLSPQYEYRLIRKQYVIAYPNKFETYFDAILERIEKVFAEKGVSEEVETKKPTHEYTPKTNLRKKEFEYLPERGIMINPEDGQRNVSFRSDTLINLLGGIYEKVASKKKAEKIFYLSGYGAGKNFGDRINSQWNLGSSLEDIKLKFDKWCEFDSTVGWGRFSIAFDYDKEKSLLNGKLTINEAFIVDNVKGRKICGFIRGYCTGVIETLLSINGIKLKCAKCPLNKTLESECVFEFSVKA